MGIPSIAARALTRLMFWFNIFKKVRGVSIKMQLGMILSAFVDVLLNAVTPSLAALPRVYVSGTVYSKSYDVYFYVRAFSDDLYSVMPEREGDVNELILNCLKKGDLFVDVGANIGYYSVLVGKIVGENGRVISVEPIPNTTKVLNFNLELNNLRNVKVVQKAAWSDNGTVTMYIPKGYFGMASVYKPSGATDVLTVKRAPLDGIFEASRVDLLKIDTEGSEYPVLVGARKILKKTKYVILEASQEKDKIVRLLGEEGFKIRKLKFTTYIFAYRN